MNILEHGHWDGSVFVFEPPLEMAPGKILRHLDTSGIELGGDLTVEMVIEGLLDPHRQVSVVEDRD